MVKTGGSIKNKVKPRKPYTKIGEIKEISGNWGRNFFNLAEIREYAIS